MMHLLACYVHTIQYLSIISFTYMSFFVDIVGNDRDTEHHSYI